MQTHVNTPAKNHNAQRYIISRCGSERIAEEEEEEIERNVKEFSSAKSATFFSSAFSTNTSLSHAEQRRL